MEPGGKGREGSLRLSSIGRLLLVALLLAASVGVIGYVYIAIKQIEEELPLRVMEEKRDMERAARNLYQFLAATEAAKAHPTEGNVENIRNHLASVEHDLETLRSRYTFDTLIGASALHALINPAVVDARIWLTDGFGALPPTSPILLDLVDTRVRDTMSKVFDKTTEADRVAYEILERQTAELSQLRDRLMLVLVAVVVLAVAIVWLAVRQQKAARARQLAEEARQSAQSRLQDALESTSEGFAFFDGQEKLVIANSRYRDFFLRDVRDAVAEGASFEAILRAVIERALVVGVSEDSEGWLAWRLSRFRAPQGPIALEYADGRWVRVDERRTGDGGTVVIYSDITELKRREVELLKAKEGAEAVSEAKSNFLANVSHELRTPLTSILGFAEIVRKRLESVVLPQVKQGDRKLDRAIEQIRGNLDIILLEGDRLTKLVNDVLDLEKIEAGEMVWKIEPLDVVAIVHQAATATESLYRQKGLAFEREIAADLPKMRGDHDRVVQVLVNLISNAVKFTPSGRIACRAQALSGDRVEISVTDSGSGIAREDQAAIFEKFRQVGDTLTQKPSGTGLGLPICREIIEHLGGEITVASSLGQGSSFAFWLPAATVPSNERLSEQVAER